MTRREILQNRIVALDTAIHRMTVVNEVVCSRNDFVFTVETLVDLKSETQKELQEMIECSREE
jgi:hypothetical protein